MTVDDPARAAGARRPFRRRSLRWRARRPGRRRIRRVSIERILLARPRGYCAGVERAVETVERDARPHGPPVYVRKEIVHNIHVVRRCESAARSSSRARRTSPRAATVVLSAHGVAPEVHANAARRRLRDDRRDVPARDQGAQRGAAVRRPTATRSSCRPRRPRGGRRARWARRPRRSSSCRRARTSTRSSSRTPRSVAYITQTTLSVDETRGIIAALRARFPTIVGPPKDDICYATTNRQAAVKSLAREVDLVLVIGSRELVQLAAPRRGDARPRRPGAPDRQRVATSTSWLDGVAPSASPPAHRRPSGWSSELVDWFRARGVTDVSEHHVIARGRALHAAEDDPRRRAAVSDPHAGRLRPAPGDACRRRRAARPAVLETLLAALEGVDRLVLLGDTLELRQGDVPRGPRPRGAGRCGAIGERLEGRPVVLVPGNHDHALARRWLERREHPLGLENRCAPERASPPRRQLAEARAGRTSRSPTRGCGSPTASTRPTATTSTCT